MGSSDSRQADLLIGATFAERYLVQSRLGKGGMALVYKALDKNLGRDVALKVLRTDVAPDPVAAKRLIREARAAAQLHHPNIITMHDVGESAGRVFVVMEVLVGQPMSDLMEQEGSVPIERALVICEQVASALSVAHAQGIIHRDIKPENLFLIDHGGGPDFVKVLDFSIAKLPTQMVTAALTRAGSVFGTPHYMAPEQVEGKQAGPPTDLYALGAVLYELIMGEPPYDGPSVIDILLKHVKQPVPHLQCKDQFVPKGLDDLIQQLLAKKMEQRPQNASEVRERIGQMLIELRGEQAAHPATSHHRGEASAPRLDREMTQPDSPPALPQAPAAVSAPPILPTSLAPVASQPTAVVFSEMPTAAAPVEEVRHAAAAQRRQPSQSIPDDLPDDVLSRPAPSAPTPRKFASFGEDDGDSRTLVGVGIGHSATERPQRAEAPARPPIALPPRAVAAPVAGPSTEKPKAKAAIPPPPPGQRAPTTGLAGIEAPGAIRRAPTRTAAAAATPGNAGSTFPTAKAGSMAPVPPLSAVALGSITTARTVDMAPLRRPGPEPVADASRSDRAETQPDLGQAQQLRDPGASTAVVAPLHMPGAPSLAAPRPPAKSTAQPLSTQVAGAGQGAHAGKSAFWLVIPAVLLALGGVVAAVWWFVFRV